MGDRESFTTGLIVTVFVHLFIGGLFVSKEGIMGCGGDSSDSRSSRFENAETIEAALAFKKQEVASKQPQKQKKRKFRPKNERGASRDENAKPSEDKKDDSLAPKPDEIDINSIFDKNRKQDEDLSDYGVDEVGQEGAADGSEWGTETEAKGDPYVGELRGRIYAVWKVPSLETGTGKALGCVRLDTDGKIIDRELVERSSNSNLNRSVELALKETTDMEEPVPDHLKLLLTEKGICFNFVL